MGSLGAEQILVIAWKGAGYGKRSKGFAQRADELCLSTLTYEDAKAIEDVPNVKSVTPNMETINFAEYEDKKVQAVLVGTTSEYKRIQHSELSEGRFFTPEDKQPRQK